LLRKASAMASIRPREAKAQHWLDAPRPHLANLRQCKLALRFRALYVNNENRYKHHSKSNRILNWPQPQNALQFSILYISSLSLPFRFTGITHLIELTCATSLCRLQLAKIVLAFLQTFFERLETWAIRPSNIIALFEPSLFPHPIARWYQFLNQREWKLSSFSCVFVTESFRDGVEKAQRGQRKIEPMIAIRTSTNRNLANLRQCKLALIFCALNVNKPDTYCC